MFLRFTLAIAFAAIACAPQVHAQIDTVEVQLANPTNPYRTIENWAQLPSGVSWGQVISVDPDIDGKSMWVFHRAEPPILKFDSSGKFLKSFGDNMFVQPHGMTIDRQGNVWVTDAGKRNGKGDQVFEFSPDGKVLMTLGTAGVSGEDETHFNGPADVAIASNGDIFVADGHVNSRVVKFSKDGKFIKAWGKKGSGPGEFDVVHTLAFDSQGRLFVGDRNNSRIQIFNQDGKYLTEWKQFGRPSGIFIDKNDRMYVADSDSNMARNPGWKRGIRIGSAKTGQVTAFIPDTETDIDGDTRWDYRGGPLKSVTSGPEGVAVDAAGNVYGAEVGPRRLMKYVEETGASTTALPDPYHKVENWAKLPAGMKFGQVISVDSDAKGNMWVFNRADPPLLEFDQSGKLLRSFGSGMFVQAHGMFIDRKGFIWLSDGRAKDGKGEQVFKLDPKNGHVLLTLGKAGVAGDGPDTFNGPSDIAIAANGDIFVADGHGGKTNARVVKFSKDGKFIKAWGKKGSAPGEFDIPHSVAIDSQGRVFVADRNNNRIQIFDQNGNFITQWKQFGRPSGIYISKNDTIYVIDSESNTARNPGFKRGIRIGSAKTGKITAFIPDSEEPNPDTTRILGAEGVGVDPMGNVYAAEVGRQNVIKYKYAKDVKSQ